MKIKKFVVTVAIPYDREVDDDSIIQALKEYDTDLDQCAYEVEEVEE